ncbi:MAG TPA: ABC transporter substrate-binding protein [Desulfocapsa sulfexigens]|nr:ABC transporter substrate-binding protein [Desulfocapsa sulfexigens]
MKEIKFSNYEAFNIGNYPLSSKESNDGVALLQEGAFNLYAMVPCPMLPRFNREFQESIEAYNKKHDTPLYSATLAGVGHDEVEEILRNTENIEDLPEAFISTGSHWQLCHNFRRRFIDTGLYRPYFPPHFAGAMPEKWKKIADKYKQGFLAVSSWDFVYDLSFGEDGPFPKRFIDLARPEFEGMITLHSCDQSPGSMALLRRLKDEGGPEALAGFARNVGLIKHFAKILKDLGSGKSNTTPFNFIPRPVTTQIPSHKRFALIDLEDGRIPMDISILVKQDRFDDAKEALAFFYSKTCRKLFNRGSFEYVDELDPDERFAFPDWDALIASDADESKTQLTAEFMLNFRGETDTGKGCLA